MLEERNYKTCGGNAGTNIVTNMFLLYNTFLLFVYFLSLKREVRRETIKLAVATLEPI